MSAPAVPPRPYKYQFYKDIHSKEKQSTDSQSSNFKNTPQLQKYSTGVETISNYQSPNSTNNVNSNDMDDENELIRSALESLNINKDHGSKDFKVKISQETMRKCTMANVFFLDHYCDLMLYIAQRKLRLQSFRNDISAKQYELSHFEIERQWKLYCGKERAYLRKRRTRLKVSSFRIHSQVGQGGYGEVYLARKKDTNEICALKRMNKKLLSKMGEIQHILTERDILTRAESLWLVKLLYAFQDADYVYLAMEYVPGGDMRTLLNNYGVLREEHARFYFAEMLMGVAELHRLGYIHRDLKPENFLIDASGHVKLTDFGLSRGILSQECIDALKTKLERIKSAPFVPKTVEEKINIYKSVRRDAIMAYSLVGSPDYMAPEVLTNNGQGYGIAVDYWSLGCILFELLAGYPPFTASKSDDVWSNVYHWKKVLERPVYSGEDEEFNFSDVAWNLITRLISDVSTRICKVSDLQNHPFFTSLLFSNLRTSLAPLPPFVPQLSSELDVSYFDDFSNTKDMAIYKEVWERQERLQNEVMSKKDDNSVPRTIFVGFTFKHKGKKQIVTDCDDLDQQSMTIKYENTNMCYMFYNT